MQSHLKKHKDAWNYKVGFSSVKYVKLSKANPRPSKRQLEEVPADVSGAPRSTMQRNSPSKGRF